MIISIIADKTGAVPIDTTVPIVTPASRIPASTATTITLLEPVVAAALAAIIVGEQLTTAGWAGVALIFTCLVCITLPARRKAQAVNVAVVKPNQC